MIVSSVLRLCSRQRRALTKWTVFSAFLAGVFFSHHVSASTQSSLQQTTAVFPVRPSQLPRLARLSPLAEQASAGFSILSSAKGGAALQSIRRRAWSGDEDVARTVLPVCGQAAEFSTLGCWDLLSGETLADIPVPGQLTTVPQFHDGAWYVGTARGFFIRIDAIGPFLTPGFGIDSQLFHGPDARSAMKSLIASLNITGEKNDTSLQNFKARFRGAWQWFATANAEFIGTPQFGFGQVFVLTANQSLNAYDTASGRLNWSIRLAPDAQLRLSSYALGLHERGVLVGTSDGYLLLLDPKNGQLQWRQNITASASDRFPAVAAPALTLGDGVVVSNAESLTQKFSWEGRSVDWTYPVGAVVQSKFDEGAVFIAGSDGAVHKLDARTGQLLWKKPLPVVSPFVALTMLKRHNVLFAATASGSLHVLSLSNGDLLSTADASSHGPVVGDFFVGRADQDEVCLSYRTPGFACWTWNSSQRTARYGN